MQGRIYASIIEVSSADLSAGRQIVERFSDIAPRESNFLAEPPHRLKTSRRPLRR